MHLAGLYHYPLKSAKGQLLDQAWIGPDGIIGDRVWMLVDDDGDQITARECPALLQLDVLEGHLHFPGADAIVLPSAGDERKAKLFRQELSVSETPLAISQWLTRHIGRSAHLVAATAQTKRRYGAADYGGFGDLAPVLITGTASLAHLNDMAPLDIEMARFRPNIVVQTQTPFEEDHWQSLQIGEVDFDVIEPCVRCNFTFLHPETGHRDVTCEPLRSLADFHANDQGGICFGVYAVPRCVGQVQGNGVVEVTAKTPRRFRPAPSPFEPPQGRRAMRIVSIGTAAERAVHVELSFDDGQPTQITPGQFIVLHISLPSGADLTRCYTVSRILGEGRAVRITIRREPDGVVSGWFHEAARAGYSLWSSGVFGDLTLTEQPALLLSAGSGVTPFLAMAGQLPAGSCHIHYERTKAMVMGLEELTETDAFKLMLTSETGRICDAHLPKGDISGFDARICGPEGFIKTTTQIMRARGVPAEAIRHETFATPDQISPSSETFTLRIHDKTISVRGDKTLLQSLRDNGIKTPSSCEIGTCQTCRLRLISGDLTSTREAQEAGYLLSCCSYPMSDVVLDTDEL